MMTKSKWDICLVTEIILKELDENEIVENMTLCYSHIQREMSYIILICDKISDEKGNLFYVEYDDKTSYQNDDN